MAFLIPARASTAWLGLLALAAALAGSVHAQQDTNTVAPSKVAPAGEAEKPGRMSQAWDDTKELFSTIWNKGRQELYVPGYTWHSPSTYTKEQRDGYTTYAAGIGYGRTWTSDANNDHSLFAMGFQDSHNDFQPMIGYAYQWMWGQPGSLRAGVGVTAFITARADFESCKYCPFPAALPIASVSYWRISLMGAYVPKFGDRGNVAFFWGKIAFD